MTMFLPIRFRVGGGSLRRIQHPARGDPQRTVRSLTRWGLFGEPLGVHQGDPDVRNVGALLLPLPHGGDTRRSWAAGLPRCMCVPDVYAALRQCAHITGRYYGTVPAYRDNAEQHFLTGAEVVARTANRAAIGIGSMDNDEFRILVNGLNDMLSAVLGDLGRVRDADKVAARRMLDSARDGTDRLGRRNESALMARTAGARGRFQRRRNTIAHIAPRIARRRAVIRRLIDYGEFAFRQIEDFLMLVFASENGKVIERLNAVGRKRTALRLAQCHETLAAVDFRPMSRAVYHTLRDLTEARVALGQGDDLARVRELLRTCHAATVLQTVQRKLERMIYRLTFCDRHGLPQSEDDPIPLGLLCAVRYVASVLESGATFSNAVAYRVHELLTEARAKSVAHFPWGSAEQELILGLLKDASALI